MKKALFFIVAAAFLFLLSSCELNSGGGDYYFLNNSSYEVSVEWRHTTLITESGEFTLRPGAGKKAGSTIFKGGFFDFDYSPANLVKYDWSGNTITFMNK